MIICKIYKKQNLNCDLQNLQKVCLEQQFAKCAKKWPTKTSCQNIVHSCLEWQFAAFEDKNCSVCKKSLSTTICKRIVRKGNFLNKIYQVNQCGICFVYLVLFPMNDPRKYGKVTLDHSLVWFCKETRARKGICHTIGEYVRKCDLLSTNFPQQQSLSSWLNYHFLEMKRQNNEWQTNFFLVTSENFKERKKRKTARNRENRDCGFDTGTHILGRPY